LKPRWVDQFTVQSPGAVFSPISMAKEGFGAEPEWLSNCLVDSLFKP